MPILYRIILLKMMCRLAMDSCVSYDKELPQDGQCALDHVM